MDQLASPHATPAPPRTALWAHRPDGLPSFTVCDAEACAARPHGYQSNPIRCSQCEQSRAAVPQPAACTAWHRACEYNRPLWQGRMASTVRSVANDRNAHCVFLYSLFLTSTSVLLVLLPVVTSALFKVFQLTPRTAERRRRAVQRSTVQRSAMQRSAAQRNAVQRSAAA